MKNVTISMSEELGDWARVQAAKAGKSLSAWIAQELERLRREGSEVEADIAAFLSGPLSEMSEGGRIFSREEIYDRAVLKRDR
jgi:hypothetical protein